MEEFSFRQNLVPRHLDNVDDYLFAINQVQLASTGFVRAWGSNLFFNEACQCLINSINLFQQGFFDCAFYQLRQSIEISIGTLYLTSNAEEMERWQKLKSGFENGYMAQWLTDHEETFAEMKLQMAPFFAKIRQDQLRMNKYVHKQGYQAFYVKLRDSAELNKWKDDVLADYEEILCDCIGAVAVYRISIDAFPIALSDEEYALRSPDLITEAFSVEFINKYIGKNAINGYKQTQIYKDTIEWLSAQPKQNESVYMLIHYQCIDRNKEKDYIEQWNLLKFYDQIAVKLFLLCSEISRIYINGVFEYSSELRPNNNGYTCGASYYEEIFANSTSDANFPYKNAFLSRVKLGNYYTYLEHNEPIPQLTFSKIKDYIDMINTKYNSYFSL